MRVPHLTVTVTVALALALGACGGGGDAADSDGGATAPTANGTTAAPAAGDAAQGEELFGNSCASCHGADGTGIEGLGKDLIASDFVAGLSAEELVAFIKQGRPSSDPANTTGVDMPPKGGNPALSDDDLLDIIAWIRAQS